MSVLDNIEYDKNYIYDDSFCYKGLKQRICLQKSHMKQKNVNQYFLKAYVIDNSNLICQGYIYFYLNPLIKTSDFIGVYIKPEYRNEGLASLLVSAWIQFCLNNNYNFLGTIKTQRKPFLLYLLKTYGFEILDTNIIKYLKMLLIFVGKMMKHQILNIFCLKILRKKKVL